MLSRLASARPRAASPPPIRRRHGRGAALPHRASTPHDLMRAGRAAGRGARAARASSSAASTTSGTTAARRAACGCSTSCGSTCATRRACCARRPASRHRAGDARALPRRESRDLRRRRLHPAPAAAVSRGRSAGARVQHLSEGGRARRRVLVDELLRAAGPDRARSRRSRSTARAPRSSARPARSTSARRYAGLAGLLLHARHRPGDGPRASPKRRRRIGRTASSILSDGTGGSTSMPTRA